MDELDPESLERGVRPGRSAAGSSGAADQNGGSDSDKKKIPFDQFLASIFSRVVLGFLLFAGFLTGFWVAGVALHDPDTCWLLALGRFIVENHQIPAVDPFSWTFAAQESAGHHFVLYQWLTEVVFYLATVPSGLVTLLLLCAVTISTAFLSIPMSFVVRREAPFIKSAWAVVLGMLAASFHTLARPEIFSYLFLALYLQNIHDVRVSCLEGKKKIFPLVYVLAPLMVLWANMHTGFVSGIAVLFALSLGSGLALVLLKAPVKNLFLSALVALVACLFAALVNPYGIGLYAYIPELFNSPINKYIIELQPVISEQLTIRPDLFPFLLLCAAFVFLMVREIFAFWRRKEALLSKPAPDLEATALAKPSILSTAPPVQFDRRLLACELLLAFVFGAVAIYNGLEHRRVASFVTLILVGEVIALLSLASKRKSGAPLKHRFWSLVDAHSLDLWQEGGIFEMAIVALCALAGVTLVCFRISPPQLPASSNIFKVPFAAVKFIETHQPRGRLYNDQQFGDVLIYYLRGKPKVFIDTRFDMYGPRIVGEYRTIHECEAGWRECFDKWKIDWAFLLPDAPIAKKLQNDPAWKILYQDREAVILQRKGRE